MTKIISIAWLLFFIWSPPCISSFTALHSNNHKSTVRETKGSLGETTRFLATDNQPTDSPPLPVDECSKPEDGKESTVLTSALLRISYDGSRFTGWSSANSGNQQTQKLSLSRLSRKQRRRGVMGDIPQQGGFVRPVEGVIRENLARIFGNVDPKRIVVEGCSRTDRGVHAQGMIAQVYCLKAGVLEALEANDETIYCSIPGKRKPHPTSSTDSLYFEPMPMDGNLSRLIFALNRMRPPDVQVTGIAPTPLIEASSPFHPSMSVVCKTYEYRISVGGMHDPTMRRWVWHQSDKLDIKKMKQTCEVLQGTRDFSAFQGAPRGPDDKRRRLAQPSTPRAATCTLTNVDILEEEPPIDDYYFPGVTPSIQTYKIVVTGDRFLYKMVRFLVGALVAVGSGKLELEDVERAMETGNWNIPGEAHRRKQFECAPAHALVLRHADYGDDISVEWQPFRY